MKKCSHWVMQGRVEDIKANSGAQVIRREEGRWSGPLQGASWGEKGAPRCPVTLLFRGWNRGNLEAVLC